MTLGRCLRGGHSLNHDTPIAHVAVVTATLGWPVRAKWRGEIFSKRTVQAGRKVSKGWAALGVPGRRQAPAEVAREVSFLAYLFRC
jgi:hypothetical protein